MRIRRGFLFWGLFFIALGTVPLLVRTGVLPEDLFTDIWRWWPLLLIGLGIAILLGRGMAGLVGTAIVAVVLGAIVGSLFASGNLWVGSLTECAGPGGQMSSLDRSGTFSGAASAKLDLDCGSATVTVKPGSDWTAHADYRGPEPRIEATPGRLALMTPEESALHRQEWTVALGADAIRDLDIQVNAGSTDAILSGAALADLQAHLNAGDLFIDGTGATIDDLDVSVNAGSIDLILVGPTSGNLSANAGSIDLCVPADANLQLQVKEQLTFATNMDDRGMSRNGDTWTRAGTGPTIDLVVEGNAAAFTLDPEGGCK